MREKNLHFYRLLILEIKENPYLCTIMRKILFAHKKLFETCTKN